VLEACGIKAKPTLMHVNRDYAYDGSQYELETLFQIEDLTREVAARPKSVPALVRWLRKKLTQAEPPDIEPGRQCPDPAQCEFYDV
jgi:hypothetical protein